MASSSDVFILSSARAPEPAEALMQVLQTSGVDSARVQDFLLGVDDDPLPNIQVLAHQAKLACPAVMISSSLRALVFAAQSILCEDVDMALVGGVQAGQAAALLLGSPSVVGIYNLMPLARLDAHSFAGVGAALQQAQLTAETVQVRADGKGGVLLVAQVVEQLQQSKSSWGMASAGLEAILVERI